MIESLRESNAKRPRTRSAVMSSIQYSQGRGPKVPALFEASDVLTVLCSDLHISHKAPLARSVEQDWYAVQAQYLDQLTALCRKYRCPCIIAGDLFDKWNAPAECINFALAHLPDQSYAVPGQHDLPYHNYRERRKSAYWTLVKAGKVVHLKPNEPLEVPGTNLRLHGFPFGFAVKPWTHPHDLLVEIAVVHQYVYTKDQGYEGAPLTQRLRHFRKRLRGYDAVVVGDNHSGFLAKGNQNHKTIILNSGAFMRRKSDEQSYRPSAGLLYRDGSIKRHYLNVSKDKFLSVGEMAQLADLDMEDFLTELENLGDSEVSFIEAVQRTLQREQVSKAVRQVVLKAMEKRK